ncbi:fluoride efflux transporter CrcB [Kribbella sp. NPDC048915]|uniref:fluoride efflux transporter CrcB n=1 Tax=Kribbella sp. NPDC048915 TaxID=3155148 RepID=UPI00340D7249
MQHDPAMPKGPVDPDVDLTLDARTGRSPDLAVIGVIAIGGAFGAAARYLVGIAWPAPPQAFPISTLVVNVVGCALIGILMVVVTDVLPRQRYLRPFLGTGVLGGFTTFSTYAVDIERLVSAGEVVTGLLYLVATIVGALLAVSITMAATRRLVARRMR